MQVLDLVAQAASPPAFAELAAASGLPRGTLHRLLTAWVALDMIVLAPEDRRYRPGPHLLTLARNTWERMDVRAAAAAPIRRVSAATGETVHLAVLSGDAIVWLDKVESSSPLRLHSAVGGRGPVHCTAVGKAMMAFLDPGAQRALLARLELCRYTERTLTSRPQLRTHLQQVREAGVAFDLEEHREGIHCVGAPVFDYQRRCVAAISITAPVTRVDLRRLRGYAALVRGAADEAAATLGGAGPAVHPPSRRSRRQPSRR